MANATPVTGKDTVEAPAEADVKKSVNSAVKATVSKPAKQVAAVKKSKGKTTHGNKRIDS